MDGSTHCADITIENIICTAPSFSQSCENSYIECEQSISSCMDEEAMPQKAIDISSVGEKDDVMVQVLGIALSRILHVNGTHTRLAGTNPTSDQDAGCSQKEIQSLPLDSKIEKDSSKHGSTLSSEEALSYPQSSVDGREEFSSMSLHNQGFPPEYEAPVFAHSPTSHGTMKLASAMKGSRERQGMPLNMKLSVKWAPEVYDPPVTSSSHTVRRNYHHSKAKKKEYREHKHSKGRSSRESNSKRKHATRRSSSYITDPRILRFQAPGDRLLLNGFGQSDVEFLDYGVVSHELKCGSNYCMESLANVHLPIAEAS